MDTKTEDEQDHAQETDYRLRSGEQPMTAAPASQWSLPQISAQARKVFIVALPFAVLFWAYGLGFDGDSESGKAWLNLPMVIAILAFIIWVGASLALLLKRHA